MRSIIFTLATIILFFSVAADQSENVRQQAVICKRRGLSGVTGQKLNNFFVDWCFKKKKKILPVVLMPLS